MAYMAFPFKYVAELNQAAMMLIIKKFHSFRAYKAKRFSIYTVIQACYLKIRQMNLGKVINLDPKQETSTAMAKHEKELAQ